MRTTLFLTPTPPEPDDGIHQPRDHAVVCLAHQRPTFRRDTKCDACLDETTS